MKDALAIHRMLLERETLHEIVRLPIPITNADDLPKAGLPAGRCLATRVYDVTTRATLTTRGHRLAAVIVPAGATVGTEPIRRELGARTIRPAGADQINSITEFAAELVCPVLLPTSMTVLIDQWISDRLHDDDVVYTATGESWTALGIRAADLRSVSGAGPVDLAPALPTTPIAKSAAKTAAKSPDTKVPVPRRGHRSVQR
jgi:prolyl-tRNA editing enzyme YbaK/EbsC (Cys-tRNA(Pro) deacylase)